MCRDEGASQRARDSARHPDRVGDVVDGQRPLPVPVAFAEANQVQGKALVGHPVGEKSQPALPYAPQVDGEGGAHEQVAKVDGEGRGDDRCDARPRSQHGHGDKLGAAGKNQRRHDPDGKRGEARLLGKHAEGQADGNVAQADGPGGAQAVLEDGRVPRWHCMIGHKRDHEMRKPGRAEDRRGWKISCLDRSSLLLLFRSSPTWCRRTNKRQTAGHQPTV